MALENAKYEITFDTPELDTIEVTAAYTMVDGRYPGWLLLKDRDSVIVALVRENRTLAITRGEALAGQPARTAPDKPAAPSPAAVAARLAGKQ
jgi:hypothetical protein